MSIKHGTVKNIALIIRLCFVMFKQRSQKVKAKICVTLKIHHINAVNNDKISLC